MPFATVVTEGSDKSTPLAPHECCTCHQGPSPCQASSVMTQGFYIQVRYRGPRPSTRDAQRKELE
ncbi:uncharacterized protein ColSpa_03464 [Colletotrichum spaethianum]|uniref:Uncharacterized protein n=1 Tax=Colletotrichum spaethianum TaxID=700344 RepID=A0AA37P096_9PEZI|nr:uncharacterized protein ColSpa_03464 [Colletotrichum spaethianum]GKT43283.1 hypothetical protein ColSpa_03464 [Colletotrichum spaethianum]